MPIIETLLDIDFYKFTMGRLVFKRYCDVPVKYAFQNRTSTIKLAEYVQEHDLRRELDHVRTLSFNNSELHYLRGTNEYGDRMFAEEYLEFLGNLQLPEYHLEEVEGSYRLEFPGAWSEAIYWETLALAIISEAKWRKSSRTSLKPLDHWPTMP
jgi:nicotinate phosphoribosyltransferase